MIATEWLARARWALAKTRKSKLTCTRASQNGSLITTHISSSLAVCFLIIYQALSYHPPIISHHPHDPQLKTL